VKRRQRAEGTAYACVIESPIRDDQIREYRSMQSGRHMRLFTVAPDTRVACLR